MVATAHIINATLVVPKLDKKSYWQDLGNFRPVKISSCWPLSCNDAIVLSFF